MHCRPWFVLALLAAIASAQDKAGPAATARIEGRVLDLRREPVAAATVWVATRQDPDTELARTTCDGDGHFVLQCVFERGRRLVRATAAGRCIGERVVYSADEPLIVFVHDAATLRGVLRNGSFAPVAGARVEATIPFDPTFDARDFAVTAADGSFTLTKAPLGTVSLNAFVPGEGLASDQFTVREDMTVVLSANVPAMTSIDIVVHGLPAEARRIAAIDRGRALAGLPLPPASLRLDADAKCRLENLPDAEYEFGLHAAGYVLDPITARCKAGKSAHRVEFHAELRGSAMLSWPGTLRDPDGKPIAGARIVVSPYAYADEFSAVTGADGAFRCECHIAEGRIVSVYCADPAWSASASCGFEPEKPLALVAVPACRAVARLLLADGSPAAFVTAALVENAPRAGRPYAVTTDRDGRLDMKLSVSEHALQLVITQPAGSGSSKSFELREPGAKVDLGDVKLDKPVVIEGVVRDSEGRPLPGALVWLHVGAVTGNWEIDSRAEATTRTDGLGQYRFVGPAPGEGWLQLLVDAEDQFTGPPSVEPFEVVTGERRTLDLTAAKK